MGGGHDNSPFIPYHIFGMNKIPNTPATEVYFMGWIQGSASAWTHPFPLSFSLFSRIFPSCGFYPLNCPQVKCWVTMRHTQCHQVNAEGTDYWQNSLSNPVHQLSFRKCEHRTCLSLLPSKAPSLHLVLGLYAFLVLGWHKRQGKQHCRKESHSYAASTCPPSTSPWTPFFKTTWPSIVVKTDGGWFETLWQ